MVEHPVHTRVVICSNQIAATRPVGQAVKTPPFHGSNMGSIPVRVTKNDKSELVRNEQSVRICFLSKIGVQSGDFSPLFSFFGIKKVACIADDLN